MGEKSTSKWMLKNIITLAIFTVIIYMMMMLSMVLCNVLFTPVGAYFVSGGISALLAGPFFMVMADKISNRGVLFLLSTITGLLFLVTGQVYTFVTYIIMGVIGELSMWGRDAYHNPIRNIIGFFLI